MGLVNTLHRPAPAYPLTRQMQFYNTKPLAAHRITRGLSQIGLPIRSYMLSYWISLNFEAGTPQIGHRSGASP